MNMAKIRLGAGFLSEIYMGGFQDYDPFLDPYYNTAPNIKGTQKGTIILTTTMRVKEKVAIHSQALAACPTARRTQSRSVR